MAKKNKSKQQEPVIQDKILEQVPSLARPTTLMKLDLAAGQRPREGFEGVDIWSGSKHVVDLTKYPWPFEDNCAEELHCSHYIEHIPAREIEERDLRDKSRTDLLGKDHMFAFFDECYRILAPGGSMKVICPSLRNNRAFQDPTHRRFIPAETFLYLSEEWRKINMLDHYRVNCNFGINVVPTVPVEVTLLNQETSNMRMNNYWNVVIDWDASLKSLKK